MATHPLGPAALGALALTVLAAAALVTLVLPRLAEPDEPGDKLPYRTFATPRMALATGAAAAVLLAPSLLWLPARWWPVWCAWAGVGSCLGGLDLATTWLPRPLTRTAWVATGVGATLGLGLGGSARELALPALAACLTFAGFWAVWRFSGQLGYGDVRLAPLASGVAATGGVQVWWAALMVTALVGLTHGLLVRWARRRCGRRDTAFPYGPALVVGPSLGLLLAALV